MNEDASDAKRVLADPETSASLAGAAATGLLQGHSPAEAFDILAPWATSRGARAEAILRALDERLSAAEPLDPRWEPHCRELASQAEETPIRESADGVARGMAHHRLPGSPLPPFAPLSLPDSEGDPLMEPYPLLVVGFEPDREWKAPEGSWMPTLYDVQHRSGGRLRTQVHLVGFVVRPPPALVALLAPLIEAADFAHLAAFTVALRAILPGAPQMAWGREAVVVSEPSLDVPALRGLPVIHFETQRRPWDGPQFHVSPWPRLVEHAAFSRAHVDELRAAAALAGRSALRLAVLWANSD